MHLDRRHAHRRPRANQLLRATAVIVAVNAVVHPAAVSAHPIDHSLTPALTHPAAAPALGTSDRPLLTAIDAGRDQPVTHRTTAVLPTIPNNAPGSPPLDLAQDREHRATDTTRPQQDLVKWAERRFLAAGLTPPSPHVHFASGLDDCDGHPGVYQPGADRITICVGDHASDFIRRPLILHELAHAWVHEHLTANDRAAFVELRGAASWNDRDDPWAERATEHAAETIAWGLIDVAVDFGATGPTDDASLRSAFLSLTGVVPINDGSHPADDATETPEPTVTART